MNNRILLILILKLQIILECISKKLILLPYNSELCNKTNNGVSKFQEFTITQQLNFETNSNVSDVLNNLEVNNNTNVSPYFPWQNIDNEESQYYFCRVLIKPMGRAVDLHNEKGEYSFWNIRSRINNLKSTKKCSDSLLLQYRHTHNSITALESHSAKIVNITCKDSLPTVIPSSIRKLYLTYFSSDPDSGGFIINVTSFIYFQGEFSITFQKEMCRNHDGFWCGNQTNRCVYRDLRCDGSDSCFDGGSDELNCSIPGNFSNFTRNGTLSYKNKGAFIDYLPWLALAILPLILLMALVCICNQHRSEVFFDDEEDNLDIEKSQDENADHLWSSLDGLDQIEKIDEDKDEIVNNCDEDEHSLNLAGKEPLIGLQTINCPATIKADIIKSCTGNSLNKDYEDIDKPTTTVANGDTGSLLNSRVQNSHKSVGVEEASADIPTTDLLTSTTPNNMTLSQITDDDYVLEDVGSLLRKVDKSKIPEEMRINSLNSTTQSENEVSNPLTTETALDYRSDYILV